MSAISSPARSPIASGSVSPASKQHGDTLQLTPRSKVKAMMAAVDDDSDSSAPTGPRNTQARATPRVDAKPTHSNQSGSPRSSNNYSEDDSYRVLAPRGKVASRLRTDISPTHESSASDEDDPGDAYARLKRKLASPPKRSPQVKERSSNPQKTSFSSEEDEPLPIVVRRKRRTSPVAPDEPQSPATSVAVAQRSSPGLFLTPEKEQKSPSPSFCQRSGSDDDLPENPQTNSRFLALVARKREEREAKAKAKAEKKAQSFADLRAQRHDGGKERNDPLGFSEDDSDLAGGKKLTQQARPTRKASKKALEEMNRETQRMNRNMQLAHQARTKKKITKESLFARFNFRTANPSQSSNALANSSSVAASSNPVSDAEARPETETPSTSPITPGGKYMQDAQHDQDEITPNNPHERENAVVIEKELPDMQTVIAQSQETWNNVKAQAADDNYEQDLPNLRPKSVKAKTTSGKNIRVRLPKSLGGPQLGEDSESDLEVLPIDKTKRKPDVFDRLPAAKASEARSLQTLRALAHLTSPNKRTAGTKSNMSLAEMQNSLQKRARQQAARERAEKIQELKDRGVIIQTAEEKQKDQAEIEDLLEKARREAGELKQKEKDVARKRAKANGETPVADDSSDEDEDYQDNDADESEVDLSGSEEEGENQTDIDEEGGEEQADDQEGSQIDASLREPRLIEDEASEASDEEDEGNEASNEEDEASDSGDDQVHPTRIRRMNKVVDDEEDEEMQEREAESIAFTQADSQPVPNLGLPDFAGAPMGMTQAFALTMADSQTQDNNQEGITAQEEDSLAFLGAPPEPELPVFDMDDSPQMVLDSQEASISKARYQNEITLDFSQSQSQESGTNGVIADTPSTQMSQIPDPTQDVGFILTSPVAGRYESVPPSTVDTVIVPQIEEAGSPVLKRKSRLMRKGAPVVEDESDAAADDNERTVISANAFDVLKKGSKKPSEAATKFDKKKSNAHEMVEEQAQESEDEYAGLGGASDDESGGEEDEEIRKMIEQGEVDVDERELAAFYANKERASDEKAVEKLFKDINNGMLRRKRGAEFDLSDSEDDDEARRRRKRREFAKMRKALLDNGNLGKIAEDPKKMAFLRAIEDREDDEDLDFLDQPEDAASQPVVLEDGSQETAELQPPATHAATTALGKRKRPLSESAPDAANRPPPAAAARRAPATSKPQSLAEIRASVSFLIEEPDAIMPTAAIPSSSPVASDNEIENDENADTDTATDGVEKPFDTRRRRTNAPVIDRLSLKRTSTASSTTTSTSNSN
ncbi:MAG: hypothetical protein L6R39_004146, partial [Caloplaca ligustica]